MKHTVEEIELANGIKGLLVHVPDASVMTFDINFRAGEYLVDPMKWEVPHLMEHVLLGANELIPNARDFMAQLEMNGAYSNASTGVYDITYEAECADFEWQRVLELLLVAIAKPLFLQEEFAAEYGNVQEEMATRSNNNFRRLNLEMRKALGLIGKTDAERLELMKNVKLNDVIEHYKKTHFTPNMRFVIAGKITPSRRKAIEKLMLNMGLPTNGQRFDLPSELPKNRSTPVYLANDTVENLYFYIDTFMNGRLTDAQTDALSLINTMLTETLYSKILGAAREWGLVYGMSSGLSQTRDATNWWFGAQVSEKNAPALMYIITKELHKVLRGELDDSEIATTKQYALGRFQRSAQTVGGTASGYAGRYFFDDVIESYYQVPERIRAITKEEIISVARNMFAENIWGIGVLGNCGETFAQDLQTQLSSLWEADGIVPQTSHNSAAKTEIKRTAATKLAKPHGRPAKTS